MLSKVTKCLLLALCLLVSRLSFAQQEDTVIMHMITLDSFVVEDVAEGLDISRFITLIQEDTSFYEAFENLRRIDYAGSTTVRMFDTEHLVQAMYSNRMQQDVQSNCRSMSFPFEVHTGDFFDKNGKMNYLTAGVFSYIFLYRDTICGNIVQTDNNAGDDAGLEQRKDQLKVLIFNPGKSVNGIPLIGDKMEIFAPHMQPYYTYDIHQERYATGVDCYVFTVQKTPEAEKGKDVVINNLTTWFDKKTMEIVARQYQLSYFTPVFDFDVSMDVRLGVVNGLRVPVKIDYHGYWDIPMRKPEIGSIQILVKY